MKEIPTQVRQGAERRTAGHRMTARRAAGPETAGHRTDPGIIPAEAKGAEPETLTMGIRTEIPASEETPEKAAAAPQKEAAAAREKVAAPQEEAAAVREKVAAPQEETAAAQKETIRKAAAVRERITHLRRQTVTERPSQDR